MCPVRVPVTESDVPELELALGYALSVWTNALTQGQSPDWEMYAMTGHAIRNTLSWMGPVEGARVVYWSGDASETLLAVARQVERGPPAFAALSDVVRRYADLAAQAAKACCTGGTGDAEGSPSDID